MNAPQRIAVFRALQLGDLLLAVPALRSLRAGFPEAEITLISLPWAAAFAEHFRHYVDRFVPFPGYPGLVEIEAEPGRTVRFLQEQRACGYDLVIQMHGSGTVSNRLALDLGGAATAGYYPGESPDGLTVGAPYPEDDHEVLRNLGLALLLGCPDRGRHLEFPLFAEDRREAASPLARLAPGDGPTVALHSGARAPAKRWPARSFAVVADELARRHGARIVLIGGPGEEGMVQAVIDRMETPALNLAGKTSLGGLAALIAGVDLFIGNDTGPAHLAYAMVTPSVTIFGPVDPARWTPLDTTRHLIARRPVACSPCGFWECPIDHPCLARLHPETILEAVERLLSAGVVACSA